jgi:hypothetical protein
MMFRLKSKYIDRALLRYHSLGPWLLDNERILLGPDIADAIDEDTMYLKCLPGKTVSFMMILRALSCACQ